MGWFKRHLNLIWVICYLIIVGLLFTCASPAEPPKFIVIPPSQIFADFEGKTNSLSQEMVIGKIGIRPLEWIAKSDTSWLTITPNNGIINNENVTLKLNVKTDNFSKGDYAANIQLINASNLGDNLTIPIKLIIAENPTPPIFYAALDEAELLKYVGKTVIVKGFPNCIRPNTIQLPGKILSNSPGTYASEGRVVVELEKNTVPTQNVYLFFITGYSEGEYANADMVSTSHFRIFVSPKNIRKYDRYATLELASYDRKYYLGDYFYYYPFSKIQNKGIMVTGKVQIIGNAPAIELINGDEIVY